MERYWGYFTRPVFHSLIFRSPIAAEIAPNGQYCVSPPLCRLLEDRMRDRSLSTGIWSAPPGPPFNVGGEKRARPALASQTFSSTLIGGQGGRLTKAAQSDQCSRSLDRDAHQISHSVHLFSHFFATIDCNQNQRHLGGDSHTSDSHCNFIFVRYCPVLSERSHIGDPDPSSN